MIDPAIKQEQKKAVRKIEWRKRGIQKTNSIRPSLALVPLDRLCEVCQEKPLRRDNQSGRCYLCQNKGRFPKRGTLRPKDQPRATCKVCEQTPLRADNQTGICSACQKRKKVPYRYDGAVSTRREWFSHGGGI